MDDGLFLIFRGFVAALLQDVGARLLHAVFALLALIGGERADVLDVLLHHVGALDDVALAILGVEIGVLVLAGGLCEGLGLGDRLFLFDDDALELGGGLAEKLLGVLGRGDEAGEVAELVARVELALGGAEERAALELFDGILQRVLDLALPGGLEALGEALGGGAFGVLGEVAELVDDADRFVADGGLFVLLDREADLLVFVEAVETATLGGADEALGFLQVAVLAVGELGEAEGKLVKLLLALVLEEELAELDDDGLLSAKRLGDGAAVLGGVLPAGGAEELDHAGHFLIGKFAQDALDGAEDLDVFAFAHAVVFELGDDRGQVFADVLGGGADHLLLALGLADALVDGRRRGGGKGWKDAPEGLGGEGGGQGEGAGGLSHG